MLRIAMKLRNVDLAKYLWGIDDDGKTWEYIYFMINDVSFDIEISKLSKSGSHALALIASLISRLRTFPKGLLGRISAISRISGYLYFAISFPDRKAFISLRHTASPVLGTTTMIFLTEA